MTRPILRLYVLVLGLFALLVFFTSRWTVFEAGALRDNALNHRSVLEELQIRRGTILADDGHTLLARSLRDVGHTYKRSYPTGDLFAYAVGYSNAAIGSRAGLERARNDVLTGDSNELGNIFNQLSGRQRQGENIVTTLDPGAQRVAVDGLRSAQAAGTPRGAVVAIDPRTGAIKVMATQPSFDPNRPPAQRPKDPATQIPTLNPPGSTFKVVTAAAALDTGKFTPSSVLDGHSPITVSGRPLSNDNGEQFGPVDLTKALTFSVNTVWARVALTLGQSTLAKYMRRFGFYSKPDIDFPRGEIDLSRVFSTRDGRPLPLGSSEFDTGRVGIGQGGLQVTPLQMAMVASAIANRGKLMRPHFTDRVIDADGRITRHIGPQVQSKVMSPRAALALTEMMKQVVKEGTGTAAALSGIEVAGKTGTAQVGTPGSNLTQPWFIAFAPAHAPRVAIAVTVERSNGGFGGTVAAPIAKSVMEALLNHG
jgi:peptidoglycan glycosyltransferase